jgi:hypothetical protein
VREYLGGFNARQWLDLTERLGLGPVDQAGLVNLLCWAWLSPDCAIEAADDALARLSRLGAGWLASAARGRLDQFFDRLVDGRLQARDLAAEQARQERFSIARRRAGVESGKSRRRTLVERMSSICSTNAGEGANEGEGVARNLNTQTQLRAAVAATGSASASAPSPPAGSTPHCTGSRATADISGVCAGNPSASVGGADPADEECVKSAPPHPPYRDERLSSSSSPKEKGAQKSLQGGCRGGGESTRNLFGDQPVAKPATRKPTQAHQEAASGIVDAYMAQVAPDHRRTSLADKNAAWWLANGYTGEQLLASVMQYAAYCESVQRPGEFRKSASNFFARRDPLFKSYLKGKPLDGKQRMASAGRVRTGRDLDDIGVQTTTDEAAPQVGAAARTASDAGHPANPFRR